MIRHSSNYLLVVVVALCLSLVVVVVLSSPVPSSTRIENSSSETEYLHPWRPPLPPRAAFRRTYNFLASCSDPKSGKSCEQCCGENNAQCCEDVSDAPTFPSALRPQVTIPLRFVLVIDTSNTLRWTLTLKDALLQVAVANEAFAHTRYRFDLVRNITTSGGGGGVLSSANKSSVSSDAAAAAAELSYRADAVVVVQDTELSQACSSDPCYQNPDTCSFYNKLLPAIGGDTTQEVNVVVCHVLYDGESQFPWATAEGSALQYVQLRYGALLGKGSGTPRDGGKSLVHELGHYLGLMHTFENGCNSPGDWVDDTPPTPGYMRMDLACGAASASCFGMPAPDRSNFMDYAADRCMDHFTFGQILRMEQATAKYRPKLLQHAIEMDSLLCQIQFRAATASHSIDNGTTLARTPSSEWIYFDEVSNATRHCLASDVDNSSSASHHHDQEGGEDADRFSLNTLIGVAPLLAYFVLLTWCGVKYANRTRRYVPIVEDGGGCGGGNNDEPPPPPQTPHWMKHHHRHPTNMAKKQKKKVEEDISTLRDARSQPREPDGNYREDGGGEELVIIDFPRTSSEF